MKEPALKKISITTWIFTILLLASCTESELSITEEKPKGKAIMSFDLSQVHTTSEKIIYELDLLVFDKEGDFLYLQHAYPTEDPETFQATLHEGKELIIHFVVNSRQMLIESKFISGESWDHMRQTIQQKYKELTRLPGIIPMWGITYGTHIETNKLNRFIVDLVNIIM